MAVHPNGNHRTVVVFLNFNQILFTISPTTNQIPKLYPSNKMTVQGIYSSFRLSVVAKSVKVDGGECEFPGPSPEAKEMMINTREGLIRVIV